MLNIVEIISEAEQGRTRPFLCRADDGHQYFVKRSGNAGQKALIAEWIAANLARHLDLPVPPFDIAEVSTGLLAMRPADERRDWGTDPVFASRLVENVVELRFTDIPKVPVSRQAQVLLFDAWIGNGDRILGAHGGNPNMLWSDHQQALTIIDHNLAFEDSPADVRKDHTFTAAATEWDLVFTSLWPQRLASAAAQVEAIWNQLPEVWVEGCAGLISLEQVQKRLQLFTDISDPVWNIS